MVNPDIRMGGGRLKAAGIEDALLESRLLWEKAGGRGLFEEYIERRVLGEPLQYIVEDWEFYSLPIRVAPGAFIPRQDTERLAERAIAFLRGRQNPSFLELCAGSGAVGIAVAKHTGARCAAIDISPAAVTQARENARLNGVEIDIYAADLLGYEGRIQDGIYDAIIFNPPYLTARDMADLQKEIRHEPQIALFGGEDGLEFYRQIAPRYRPKLKANGALIMEIGDTQAAQVSDILQKNGYKDIEIIKDYGKKDRVVFCRV